MELYVTVIDFMRCRFSRKFSSLSSSICVYLLLISLSIFSFPNHIVSQIRPVYDQGALGLGRLLKRLNTTASVMMIGAHPDDEDSALLAYLARRENADTAYLSLTRGDGGQNIIGPELFESLGVIRTEELLQARRLDGSQQFFTRAFDYGFSKTLAEAKQKWDEKVILCDTVRAIRLFRPLVVISRFSGTPADGHGHHQFAGYISPVAVKAAADPQQCMQSGPPWQVLKFYIEQGFGGATQAPLQLNTGEYNPMLGRSYFEIVMEGRSQHKSQGEGRLELKGALYSGLNLSKDFLLKSDTDKGVFDGLDITVGGIARLTENTEADLAPRLVDLQSRIASLSEEYRPSSPQEILPDLAAALKAANDADSATPNLRTKAMLVAVRDRLNAAIRSAAGIQIDALATKETVTPNDDLSATVNVFFPKANGALVTAIELKAPTGWTVAKADAPKENTQGFNRREVANQSQFFNIKVNSNAKPTQPYFLEEPRVGDFYRWSADGDQNLPFQPQLATAEVKIDINGTEVTLEQPLQFRYADAARGEIRRELNVVPMLSVSLDQKLLIVPESDKPTMQRVVMSITNNSSKPVSGAPSLNFNSPQTWKFVSSPSTFNLKNKGEKTSITFDVTIPARVKAGSYAIYGQAIVGEALSTLKMNTIAYPHIQTHRFYTRAETDVLILDLKVAAAKVGYIIGSGDEVPDAIRQMGLDVTMLGEKDLTSGDLSKFDSIVVGIRASETRPDFVSNFQRLLDYVRVGGNLIVQYQRPSPALQTILPYPAQIGPRVTDENAKVTFLQPAHPILTTPNKIGDADFEGWVQERNSYDFSTFDEKYVPLLEAHDAGEPENRGGLVVADIGSGKYIYCSYSMFRQLPAGVPGAYRLFANMLRLRKQK